MQTQSKLAEIKFCAQGISLYGIVSRMNQQQITIHLESIPTSAALFSPGNLAELVVVAQNTVYLAQTAVVSKAGGDLTLAFQGATQKLSRREHTRHVCELGITFRPVHAGGSMGVWRNAVTIDISMGGMCLLADSHVEVPPRMEVLFTLPEPQPTVGQDGDGLKVISEERLGGMASRERDRAIKCSAVVNNRRMLANGKQAVGISFGKLVPQDQLRLARFIGDPLLSQFNVSSYSRNKSATD